MHRCFIAALAALACLALAGPAMAQAPDPDATVTATVVCNENNHAMFTVEATGLNANESYGVMVVNSDNEGVSGATATDKTGEDGSLWAGFGSDFDRGTYTVYAYTGPFQTFIGLGSHWEGSIEVETFDPSLTTSWTSTTVEVPCGPPTKEMCKYGGFADEGYRNQGLCVSANAPGRD